MADASKRCSRCGQVKDRSLFPRQASSRDGLYPWCKVCQREVANASRLKKAYGLTPEQYAQLLAKQAGQCAICGKSPEQALELDHDHASQRLRQFLCGPCNRLLGLANDDPELLRRAAAYIERHRDG